MKKKITIKRDEVLTVRRKEKPESDITILDDIGIQLDKLVSMDVFVAQDENSPNTYGDWVICLVGDENETFQMILPLEMKNEEVLNYIKPITAFFQKGMN